MLKFLPENSEELWDIYDMDRNITGKTKKRGDTLVKGEYHLIVHICIFNSDGKFLIQKRQPWKKKWAGMWDLSAGGAAISGDDSRKAAIREAKEELGIDIDLTNKTPAFSIYSERAFDDVWIINKDISDEQFNLQEEEVEKVKWIDFNEYYLMAQDGKAVPHIYINLIEKLFKR